MKIAVILPIFNEAQQIKAVIEQLKFYNYQIIAVDDGSTDDSLQILQAIDDIAILGLLSYAYRKGERPFDDNSRMVNILHSLINSKRRIAL